MRKLLFVLSSVGLMLSGCSRGGTEKVLSVRHNEVDSLDLSQALIVKQVVMLDNDMPLGDITRVERNHAGIYIWSRNRINIYSNEGELLGQVGRSGRGPGEYVSISGFSLSDKEVLIIDSYRRLLVYDLDGEFLRGADIPFYAAAGKIFGNLIYLDSGYQNGKEKKFHVYSLETLEEFGSFQEINDAERTYRHFMHAEHYYVSGDDKLFYHESLNNRVYQLFPDHADAVYSLDFWGRTPPDSFFEHRYENVAAVYRALSEGGYISGAPSFAAGNGKFLFSYNSSPKTKTVAYEVGFSLLDSSDNSSCQSECVYFKNVTRSMPGVDMTMSFNSTKDISFAVPPDALLGASLPEDGNPVLIFAEFR